MKPIRFALSALAICVALPAVAGTTTTSYSFANNTKNGSAVGTSSTGVTTFQNSSSTQYGNDGTNYGNTLIWGGASGVTVSAWSTTGANGAGGTAKFETAFIGNYNGDLGVTSQPGGTSANVELTSGYTGNQAYKNNMPNEGNNQHAIDNVGAYDALVFSFSSAVTLSDVSIGFPSAGSGLDSDSTILYYKGTGTPSSTLSARTVSDLVSSGDWGVATNLGNMAQGNNATGISTSITSKYWLVGAYMNIGGNTPTGGVDTTADYIKVNGLTVKASTVPEPSSIALLGLAGAGLFLSRRRKVRKD